MSEFRRSFFSKTLEKSKNIISTSKQIELTSEIHIVTTDRALFTDSEDLQKNTNLYEKYKLLETKYENFINNTKKRNNLLMKAKEIEIEKFKKIIPLLKNEEDLLISESDVLVPKEKIKKWNLKNEELNIDLSDIRISLINPKCEEINNGFIENDTLLPMHIKIKNIDKYEISLQRYEINLQQSYYLKKFIILKK